MNKYFIPFFLFFLLLSACSEKVELSSPAEAQIKEYNKTLKECEEEKAKEAKDTQKTAQESAKVEPAKPPAPEKDLGIASDDMFIGDKGSKVVLVEYYSPTCPHCLSFHKRTFPEIKAKYIDSKKIAYVFREFIGTKQDLDASILARCKGNVETYMKFMDVILQQQDNWAFSKNYREILTNIGQLGSVSAEEYAGCLNNEEHVKALLDNTRVATKTPHFIGTPSFFINGKHFTKPYTFEELSKEIDKVLAEPNEVKQ
jgi:protein-disulfide isomerase